MKHPRSTLFSTSALLLLFCLCSPQSEKSETLFVKHLAQKSGITFQNDLTEGPNTNVLMYEYFYNGGGVALADFNGDQRLDIYLTSNMQTNKMYLNQGDFQFQDITALSKTEGRSGPWKTGVTAVDINGDSRMDLYVCYSGAVKENSRRNQLFLNMGNDNNGIPTFTEVAKLYGLDSPAYSNQGYFFDYDKDGDLDMLLLNHNPKSLPVLSEAKTKVLLKEDSPSSGLRLYEQRDRYFYDITPNTAINGSSLSYGLGIALSDFNNDGWTDFYVCNDYTIPDYLYINDQQGGFRDELQKSMPHTSHFSMGNDAGDINNDGLIDLMTLDMLPQSNERQKILRAPDNYNLFDLNLKSGFHYQYMRNMLHLNNGNGTFSEIGQLSGVANTDWSWAALFADYDNDGWSDLLVTNGYKRDYTNRDFLSYMEDFIENKSSNLKKEDVLEIINNMPASNISNYSYANQKGKGFSDVTQSWGLYEAVNSNGAAYGDLDNDGDLDLIINNINSPLGIYENTANQRGNYLQVALAGTTPNTHAIGAKISLYANDQQQVKEQYPARGYLSTVSPIVHFGLGTISQIDSLIVQWPDGRISKQYDLKSQQRIRLSQEAAEAVEPITPKEVEPLFASVAPKITFQHQVKNVLDFDRQKLLHFQPSFSGPTMIKADLNQDGREDIIIGGGAKQATEIWWQAPSGSFKKSNDPIFNQHAAAVVSDIAILDANLDGKPDVYIAHGGYHQFQSDSPELRDVIYLNQGNRTFKIASGFKADPHVTSKVAVYDLNQDGAPDVFLGGGIIPGSYPNHYPNQILLNDGKGNFTPDSTQQIAINKTPGIVRDALWEDLDGDGQKDLILIGEWMPIQVFLNRNGQLESQEDYFNSPLTQNGWWNRIQSSDLNGDGKTDFIVGNEGSNTAYQAASEQPVQLDFGDLDNNGTVDPILSYYIEGESYPMASRDELLAQWVALKAKYPSYASFSKVTTALLLENREATAEIQHWQATQLQSIVILSSPEGYSVKALPREAQFSPITAIAVEDLNKDGNKDLLLLGNRSNMALKLGRYDANYGCTLLGDGKGNFQLLTPKASGLQLQGDISNVITIDNTFFFSTCNDSLVNYKLNTP